MKRQFLTILLLTMLMTSMAQMKGYDTAFTLSQRNFVMTVPIEVEQDRIYLCVTMNGQSYRFLLDTGASQGVIYEDVAVDGLREWGFIKSVDATGESRQVQTVVLPPLTLGSLTIRDYKVQRMNRRVKQPDEDGIIGFALFNAGLAAKIDTRQQLLTLTDRRRHFRDADGEALKYKLIRHVPHVMVSPFEGAEDDVLFDTGSPMLYAPNSVQLATMEANVPAVQHQIEGTTYGSRSMGHFGSEHSRQITMLRLERLMWGGFAFRDVHCASVQGGSHVGAQVLRYGAMVIDPFRKLLVFQPYDGATSCDVPDNRPDIIIVERSGKAVVGMVMKEGRAWQAGFRQGYVFEKVNGQPVSFEEFNSFRWVKGLTYDFTMRLPIGICTTVVALWPSQYNKPQGRK